MADNVKMPAVPGFAVAPAPTKSPRLPPIAVPFGTHTGWNVYRAQPGELADRDGSLILFARTRKEREAAGDPRPGL
jgi:hypothetical protein